MLNKNLVMGSVTSLALAIAASGALAQSPPQNTAAVASTTPSASNSNYKVALAGSQNAAENYRELRNDYQKQMDDYLNRLNAYDPNAHGVVGHSTPAAEHTPAAENTP